MTAGIERIKVKLKGGGPWGFRLQGGPGTGLPLTVSKVRRKSKAYNNLLEGDLLVSVNGMSCNHLTYDQVMAIADKTGSEFHLEVERKEKEVPAPEISTHARQNSTVKNTTMKITESETMITEKNDSTFFNDVKGPNFTVSAIPQPPLITHSVIPDKIETTNDKTFMYSGENIENEPEITSETSSKTSSEVTSDGKKYEKLETEKVHEKHENKDTTIIRTEYEKRVEKKEVIPSIETCDKAVAEDLTKLIEHLDSEYNKTASELYQVNKTEKSEVTTKNVNGFFSSETTSLPPISTNELDSIFTDVQNLSKQLEGDHLFSSPVSSTLETFSEVTDDSGSLMISKKKKMFSSSSFYEEPHAIYPTVEEQFEMAKKIAESLADDTNKKSKGANMFFKRAKRSTKWIHEGPEPSSESAPDTPEIQETALTEVQSDITSCHKKFPKLQLVLYPRHPVDLASLRSTGHNISEHNVISPEVCHGLVRDLESPVGKGSMLFAKRKKKSSEWVVDEERVKALMEAHDLAFVKHNLSAIETPKTPYFRSPWDTASYVSPLARMDPDKLAETVIAAADVKRRDSLQSNEDARYDTCRSPMTPATPAASYYDIYSAKAPKGWSASPAATGPLSPFASSTTPSYPQYAEPFPAYSTLTTPAYAKKFNFQNFNTLPRKWKAQN